MAGFDDWVLSKRDAVDVANIVVNLDVVTPVVGDGSWTVARSAASAAFSVNNCLVSTLTRGFTKGRMRALVRAASATAQALQFGLVGMQSAQDVVSDGASCYLGYLRANSGGATTLGIGKTTNGILNFSELDSASFTWVNGTVYALQFDWAYDLTLYTGTRLRLYTGTATDFSDLILRLTVVDSATPLSTAIAEGYYVNATNHVANDTIIAFDEIYNQQRQE